MTKDAFAELLCSVSVINREFAARYVHNWLPELFRYRVCLNQSFDGHPLHAGEYVFPDDGANAADPVGPLTGPEVVELLWRDGLVPEWIDISVVHADNDYTYFELLCCGRFTADESLMYYNDRGQGPFGIKSPRVPPDWSDAQGRFDLHWYREQTDTA